MGLVLALVVAVAGLVAWRRRRKDGGHFAVALFAIAGLCVGLSTLGPVIADGIAFAFTSVGSGFDQASVAGGDPR